MRVLIINSVCGVGSTGRLAMDTARQYARHGDEVVFAYGRKSAPKTREFSVRRIGTGADVLRNAFSARLLDREGFSAVCQTERFLRAAEQFDPQLLLLHNLHGYYINVEALFRWIKSRPQMAVRWTLHDCWAFTGHCAHFCYVGCDRWQSGCGQCQQKKEYPKSLLAERSAENFARKRACFCDVENMTLVTPSQWLADLVGESFLKDYPTQVVPNRVDTSVFRPTPSDFRRRYGLENRKIILGVAAVWTQKKGLADYLRLADRLGEAYRVVLVGLTKRQIRALPSNVLGLGQTADTTTLAQIYTAADVFVNLTYEDTYPTVNLEAQACQTPCLTYRTGGCAQSVAAENVVAQGDLAAMAEKIEKVCARR